MSNNPTRVIYLKVKILIPSDQHVDLSDLLTKQFQLSKDIVCIL